MGIAPRLSVCLALLLMPLLAQGEFSMPVKTRGRFKKVVQPLPPQAVPTTAQVDPGGTVQIPLRVYGKQGKSVHYLIRSGPKLGKILALTQSDQEIWVLTYQHTSAMTGEGDLHDRIVFAAQDDNGTSAPAQAAITIVDPPPLLAAPATVEFGEVTLSSTASQTVTLANRGGHVLEGRFEIDAPWQIEPPTYRLGRGEEARFRIVLPVTSEQEYRGRLRFPDQPNASTVLHAMAAARVEVQPRTLDLAGNPADGQRAGSLTLSNRTPEEQRVAIHASPRLHLPPEIVLPANGTRTLSPFLAGNDTAGIDESVEFRNGDGIQRVAIHSLAAGPLLLAEPEKLAFGKVEVGHAKTLRLHVENRSPAPMAVTAAAASPFQIENSSLTLAAGQGGDFMVSLDPAWPGALTGKVTLQSPSLSASLEIPLTADILSRVQRSTPRVETSHSPKTAATTPAIAGEETAASQAPFSRVSPIEKIDVRRTTPTTADLAWPVPATRGKPQPLTYRIDVRRLVLDPAGGVQVLWIPLPTVAFTEEGSGVKAHLTKLPPGNSITIQIVSITPKGEASKPSLPLQFYTPAKPVIFTLQRFLLTLFAAIFLVALWFRLGKPLPPRLLLHKH